MHQIDMIPIITTCAITHGVYSVSLPSLHGSGACSPSKSLIVSSKLKSVKQIALEKPKTAVKMKPLRATPFHLKCSRISIVFAPKTDMSPADSAAETMRPSIDTFTALRRREPPAMFSNGTR